MCFLCSSTLVYLRLEIAVLDEWSDLLLVCFYGKIFHCCNCSAPQVVAMAASLVQHENHAASDVLRKGKFLIVKSSTMQHTTYMWH